MARTRGHRTSSSSQGDDAPGTSRNVRHRANTSTSTTTTTTTREEVPYQPPSQPSSSVPRVPTQPRSAPRALSQPPQSAPRATVSAPQFPSQPPQSAPRAPYQSGMPTPQFPSQPCRPSSVAGPRGVVTPPFTFPSYGVSQFPQTDGQRPFMPFMQSPMMMGGYQPYMQPPMWQGVSPPFTSLDGTGMTQPFQYPQPPFPVAYPPFYLDPTAAGAPMAPPPGGVRPPGATVRPQFPGFQGVLGTYVDGRSQSSTDPTAEEQGGEPTEEEAQQLFANPFLEAAAAKISYYSLDEDEGDEFIVDGETGVSYGGVRVDTNPVDDVVDDTPEMTEEEELMVADCIEPDCLKNRGGGIGEPVPPNPTNKRPLTLCRDGGYADPKAISLVGNIVKRVMRLSDKMTWRKFSKEEREDAWESFKQHYKWDADDKPLIRVCFNKIAQKSFQDGMNKAKKWWIRYKTNRAAVRSKKLWMTLAHLKNAIMHWRDPKTKVRSRKARENRAKRKGINYVGGSISQGIWRERLAEKYYGGDEELVPHSAVWLKTHCKVLPDKTQKWTKPWARRVYLRYLELCVEELGPNPDNWEPINMKQWVEASGGPKKGFVPGFSTIGDPEIVGFKEVRKHPKFINVGGSKEAVRKAAALIVQLQIQNAAYASRFAAQEKLIKDLQEGQEQLKAATREMYARMNWDIPSRFAASSGAANDGGSGGVGGSQSAVPSSFGVGTSGGVGGGTQDVGASGGVDTFGGVDAFGVDTTGDYFVDTSGLGLDHP